MSDEPKCSRCGQVDGYKPDDHDCVLNLRNQAKAQTKGITREAGWDSLSRSALLETEEALTDIYASLTQIEAYYDEKIRNYTRLKSSASSNTSLVGVELNLARAEVRNRMMGVD